MSRTNSHNSGRKLSGEAGAVDKVVIKNWQEELPKIIAGYDVGDIFNCDETALFFKQLTNKSLVNHGGHGDKRDKSRFRCSCARLELERKKLS